MPVLPIVAFLASCAPSPVLPSRCALRPADFVSLADPYRYAGGIPIEPLLNRIELRRDGGVRWNGAVLGEVGDKSGWAVLDTYLAYSAQLEPIPDAVLVFGRGVPCATVDRARAAMRRHLACASSGRCLQG